MAAFILQGAKKKPMRVFCIVLCLGLLNWAYAADDLYGCEGYDKIQRQKADIGAIEDEILSVANDILRGYKYVNCRSQFVVFENCDKIAVHLGKERETLDSLFGKLVSERAARHKLYTQCFNAMKEWAPQKEKGFWESIWESIFD
ncbi:MAG: hypothetical protein ACR2QC_05315 [Gammaproteobacteria bacterium]